ncbi:MAG: ERF family protein [Gemmataceae bacterium]|nr:ERF family protein [Gemmataceae bacterium]
MPGEIAHADRRDLAVADQQPTPMQLMQQAIAAGITPDQLGKMLDLQERHERNQAAKAFGEALARFQSLCPVIKKRRKAGTGKFTYTYAGYDDIHFEIRALLAAGGLTVAFDSEPTNGGLAVTCRVQHGTHVQPTRVVIPLPQMSVSNTQQFGAAMQYGKRYALCAALNIVVSDEDDDAATLVEKITDEEADDLRGLLAEGGRDVARLLQWAKCDRIEDLSRAKYAEAVDMLTRKPGRTAK